MRVRMGVILVVGWTAFMGIVHAVSVVPQVRQRMQMCGAGMPLAADSLSYSADSLNYSADSLHYSADSLSYSDSLIYLEGSGERVLLTKDDIKAATSAPKARFTPDPQRALWLSLLLPGAGQIYNRKYWKLPIVYGGFLGCIYAFTWNQQMYLDYSQAYLDIMDDDPNTKSYESILPPTYDIAANTERLKNLFKKKKDYYRRYRDISAFCFAGVYLLSVIDAYVDAQLSEFNISEDLSMRLAPSIIENDNYTKSHSYGVGCSLNF